MSPTALASSAAVLSVALCAIATPSAPMAIAADGTAESAVSACKTHVERMFHHAVSTSFPLHPKAQAEDERDVVVSGEVVSTDGAGKVTRGDFSCRATRSGSRIWTTKTEIALDP